MQRVTPRLMLAHSGAGSRQSQHWALPSTLCTWAATCPTPPGSLPLVNPPGPRVAAELMARCPEPWGDRGRKSDSEGRDVLPRWAAQPCTASCCSRVSLLSTPLIPPHPSQAPLPARPAAPVRGQQWPLLSGPHSSHHQLWGVRGGLPHEPHTPAGGRAGAQKRNAEPW